MRVINKKIIITILVILEICSIYIIYKSYSNKNLIEDKIDEPKKEKLAIKVDNGNGEYVSSSIFPGKGYALNKDLTECIDIEGNKVNNPKITSDGESVTVTSKYTNYCTLYFYLPESREYEYTGNYQVFIAPKDGEYKIELWGASGGGAYYNYNEDQESGQVGDYIIGGKGAYTKGIINLKKNDKLYVYVGEMGKDYSVVIETPNFYRPAGGYNGGGEGGSAYQIGAGGGGATDVRLYISSTGNWDDFDSLKSRIMVAGAGGGTSNYKNAVSGGYGGSLIGESGILNLNNAEHQLATGGSQVSGGIGGNMPIEEMNGKFGFGGDSQKYHGGGGGAGYYGGGGGSVIASGVSSGAGGSSYISGYTGCVAIKESSTENNVQPKDGCTDGTQNINCSYHYSNKIFIDTEMIAGNSQMPTYDGKGTMIGNTGNGHAKISFVG